MPSQKRVREGKANRILKAMRSVDRTRHKSVARIPKTSIYSKPKKVRHEAGRLATSDTQGIVQRSLLRPSFQQGRTVTVGVADGQLIEGSAEGEAVDDEAYESN